MWLLLQWCRCAGTMAISTATILPRNASYSWVCTLYASNDQRGGTQLPEGPGGGNKGAAGGDRVQNSATISGEGIRGYYDDCHFSYRPYP